MKAKNNMDFNIIFEIIANNYIRRLIRDDNFKNVDESFVLELVKSTRDITYDDVKSKIKYKKRKETIDSFLGESDD